MSRSVRRRHDMTQRRRTGGVEVKFHRREARVEPTRRRRRNDYEKNTLRKSAVLRIDPRDDPPTVVDLQLGS